MTVQPLTSDMLCHVAELERQVFSHPWSEASLALLCGDTAFGYVCFEDGVAVAYGGMLTVLDEGQITNIATHPDHRRRGYAAAVLHALLDEALARGLSFVTLEARESNVAAISLYEKLGFETVGHRPRFYTGPVEGARLMQCNLKGN